MNLRRPQLTIAPLIDCVFLLLIFFAVTASLTKELGMPVEKPKAKTSIPVLKEYILISITKEEEIFLSKQKVNLSNLYHKVKDRLSQNSKLQVVIAADKRVSTGKLIEVLDVCKSAGAENLSIATLPKIK
jgi:biopolymer transport protein ExbD